ncbi:MAG: DinB family protein [Chitinophagaceae bacterium]
MLKRTKGRILLTMLVITGLAGTVNNTTLSSQERKLAINQLKDTRTDLLTSIKDLSERQLNFRPSAGKWNIKDCIYDIALTEKELWDKLEKAMKEPATPEKRLELKISDEDLLKVINDLTAKNMATESVDLSKVRRPSIPEVLSAFKSSRTQYLKYVKTTTGDLRNHFIQLPIGWVDCYQSIIFISGYSSRYIQHINEIIANPAFPKK